MMYIKGDARVRFEVVRDLHIDITEPGPTVPTEAEVKAAKVLAEFRARFYAKQRAELRERSGLSQRESEIMDLMFGGLNNKEIAEKMFISERTARKHVHNIY